jgi:myo-inositol-1(or 4)-monophosphatase
LIEKLKNLALEAGAIFKDGFYSVKEIQLKGTVDLVTQYDIAVEEFLIPRLSKLYPDLEIIGEESFKGETYPASGVFIDPIDGTTNFAHGLPFCAISIGVWRDGEAIQGVVYNPILNEVFWAESGTGAFCNDKKLEVSKTNTLQNALVSTGFPYTKSDGGADFEWTMKRLANVLPKTRDIRRYGSASLDICYLARGVYDCFYEINLKAWDTAAAAVILKEAGGEVSNEFGAPYTLNDRCIVGSNTALHSGFINLLGC